MITVTIPFGKHRGQSLDRIPLSYLKWLQNNADLDWWLAGEIKAELARRGVRSVDAGLVLADLEEELYARISEDDDVDFALAGKVSDHVMEACDCSPAAARDRRRDTPAYHTGAKTMPDRERFVLTFETLVSDRPSSDPPSLPAQVRLAWSAAQVHPRRAASRPAGDRRRPGQ